MAGKKASLPAPPKASNLDVSIIVIVVVFFTWQAETPKKPSVPAAAAPAKASNLDVLFESVVVFFQSGRRGQRLHLQRR